MPWLIVVVIGALISFLLSGRDIRLLAKILLAIEGVGIVSMIVLVVVIFAKGGAPTTGVDFSAFSFDGVSASAVFSAVVAAFLSWAGFEACASMGEETDDPGRNIPRALAGTLILTGVLFVIVMFAQVVGFGTDAAGLASFQNAGNTLGALGSTYVGQWFSLLIIFTAIVSAFGCHLACSATSGRMLYAFGRDGFGPKSLAHIHEGTGGPRFATWLVVGVSAGRRPDLRCRRLARHGYRQPRHQHLLPVRGRRLGLPDGLLPPRRDRRDLVRRRTQVRLDVHGGKGKILGLVLPASAPS